MNQLLYLIRRILTFPVAVLGSFWERVSALKKKTGRARSLMLGLPALLIAVLGVSALCWAQFGLASNLEKRYKIAAEDSGTNKDKIRQNLGTEMRMLRAANRGSGASGSDPFAGIPEDDARRKRLSELQEEEQVYLEKLIALNQNEFDYRFQSGDRLCRTGRHPTRHGTDSEWLPRPRTCGYAKAHLCAVTVTLRHWELGPMIER